MNPRYESASADSCTLMPGTHVGLAYKDDAAPVRMGAHVTVRTGSIIYGDVQLGDHVQTGHNVLVREHTAIGNHVVIGTNTVIDGNSTIGNFVKLESGCYVPTHCRIGNRVFFGPGVCLTNDRYPLKMRDEYRPEGVVVEDGVTLCANVTVCPGVTIGEGAFVAAGAVITRDVPPMSLAKGVPATFVSLPEKLRETNMALSWRQYLEQ